MATTASLVAGRLWQHARLPNAALKHLRLLGDDPLPSGFLLGCAAQATIGVAALAAAQLLALRTGENVVDVAVSARDAVAEVRSEHVATLDGGVVFEWDELAGQYRTKDGWIRPHTNWRHHKEGFLDLLGLPRDAKKADLAAALRERHADEVAEAAMERGLVCTAMRSFQEWDSHPQGHAAQSRGLSAPFTLTTLEKGAPKPLPPLTSGKPLEGVRVLDLTRVIAGPVAGRTLAAYGADVLWVTSPNLPSLPGLDLDTSRGKRAIHLDLRSPTDRETFTSLLSTADVLLQSYRPEGLASLGFGVEEVRKLNPDIVYVSLTAWGAVDGPEAEKGGPWARRKGFDSLVQFACGIGEAEGRAWADSERRENEAEKEMVPRPLPCQALDHGSGYILAFGIMAALYHRATSGGSYLLTNTLLSTAHFFRSLGRRSPSEAFGRPGIHIETANDLRARGQMATCPGFGGKTVEYVRHAAKFEGDVEVGWQRAPAGLGADRAEWLPRRDE
ncbi:L-carnitine dehydratase/bile acid-inducible protein F [Rhodotorula toruloides]|uniref:L-carnitine dehydratase/bile acid-inducible protein F n=1 Tax=Rhodotorula toruloides TaxID=5286 RepID=A0A511KPB5_RHOTO|nr:L-carnitine dehydratase/bile acid-inducible protein F [Rhodotorula toruloides]